MVKRNQCSICSLKIRAFIARDVPVVVGIIGWLQANGTKKTPDEINAWSDEVEVGSPPRNAH
jgi:hypothetical protein